MKKHISLLSLIFISTLLISQTSISDARTYSLGSTVTVSGVATCDNNDFSSPIIYIQDGSAGIALYDYDTLNTFNISRGDSITVTGELTDFQDLLEITDITNIINHGQTNMPAPISISASGLNETNESMLVQIMHNNTDSSGVFSDYENYMFESSGDSFVVRIQGGCNVDGDSISSHYHMITGIVGEYKGTFQLIPRDSLDLMSGMTSIAQTKNKTLIKSFFDQRNKTLQLLNQSEQDWSWVMIDLTGRLIERNTLSAQQSDNLNLSAYISGIYFLSFNDGINRKTEKLIIH